MPEDKGKLTYDDNQKATKAHCRLALSAQPQRFLLPLLVELHGSHIDVNTLYQVEGKTIWWA